MLLFIDNYDSFTYTLVDYFKQMGQTCCVLYNDDPALLSIQVQDYDGVILSPGPKSPKDAGFLMDFIHKYHSQLPMLGVCLGHQALGEYFGGTLIKAAEPMHGRISKINLDESCMLFNNLQSGFKAMRYHSLIIKNEANPLVRFTAWTATNEVMALQHQHLPLFGVQFHPESISTTYGLIVLRNWLELLNI